ncbi:MAG: lipopolysaccharide assembly protein LapA domain-containing protein [Pseudomonadota bacterium]
MLKKLLFIIPILIIFFIALAFGAQNASEVTINFLIFESRLSVASVAGIFLALGFIIAVAFYLFALLKWKFGYNRLLKKYNALKRKNHRADESQD